MTVESCQPYVGKFETCCNAGIYVALRPCCLKTSFTHSSNASWQNLQVGRMHLAAATVGRQIFAMGGKTDANAATNCVERLDLDDPECSWITVNPMLEKRYHAAAATWKGRLLEHRRKSSHFSINTIFVT